MIVTAWNNGQHHSTGAGYGLKVDANDRDRYFSRKWKSVILELAGESKGIVVNTNKPSFWGPICRELISRGIGIWLIKNRKAPWTKGKPPKIRMEPIEGNRFKVNFM